MLKKPSLAVEIIPVWEENAVPNGMKLGYVDKGLGLTKGFGEGLHEGGKLRRFILDNLPVRLACDIRG